jgi:hypothetical protein
LLTLAKSYQHHEQNIQMIGTIVNEGVERLIVLIAGSDIKDDSALDGFSFSVNIGKVVEPPAIDIILI